MIPAGPILFLGAGNGFDAIQLAARGRHVFVFDEMDGRLDRQAASVQEPHPRLELIHASADEWRLGYQRWAGIIALFGPWPTRQRRRLFSQIPNALMAGGVFLMEGHAMDSEGPMELDDFRLDPEEVRPELEMLSLSRFATTYRPIATGAGILEMAPVLQIIGVHPEPGGLDAAP